MKSLKLFLILFVLGTIVSSFSSNDKDEARYSCDDGVNDFIVENFDFVSSMSREAVIKYKAETQRSIVRTWTKDKLAKVFNDKWKEDAKLFTGEKREFILSQITEAPNTKESIEMFGLPLAASLFAKMETLKEQGYDRSKLLAMNTPNFPNTAPQPENGTGGGGDGAGGTQGESGGWGNGGDPTGSGSSGGTNEGDGSEGGCDCNLGSDFCPTLCGNSGCETDSWGCGWGFVQDCNGSCSN